MDRFPVAAACERAYARFHHPAFISPDPLEVVREYDTVADREVVGLIASSLALGRVAGILAAVRSVLRRLSRIDSAPSAALRLAGEADLARSCEGFRYRFFDEEHLLGLLLGIRAVLRRYGSVESAFATGVVQGEALLGGLAAMVAAVREGACGRLDGSIMLSEPGRGSACKRLVLFARWMVRRDAIDPGGWSAIGPQDLLMPVDTHVLTVARALGLTAKTVASMRVSREITAAFRLIRPDDPVRYDFALTRPGIHPLLDERSWLAQTCTQPA